jgi:hypothetical protein
MRLSFRRPRKKDGHEPEIDAAAVHELEDVLAEKVGIVEPCDDKSECKDYTVQY